MKGFGKVLIVIIKFELIECLKCARLNCLSLPPAFGFEFVEILGDCEIRLDF